MNETQRQLSTEIYEKKTTQEETKLNKYVETDFFFNLKKGDNSTKMQRGLQRVKGNKKKLVIRKDNTRTGFRTVEDSD